MGVSQQPQDIYQVVSNMIDYGMNPQEALDSARFRIDIKDEITFVEDSFDQEYFRLEV